MNPVTRRLLDQIDDPALAELALAWDALEEHIVQVYRAGISTEEDDHLFAASRSRAAQAIAPWAARLAASWPPTNAGEVRPERNPFAMILDTPSAASVPGNKVLLRALPAARESINHLLMERASP